MLMIALFAMAALAFDAGYAQSDRRSLQAVSDSAALAGSRSYLTNPSPAPAHNIAMQYLAINLGFAMPTGACTGSSTCPAGTYGAGPYTIVLTDSGSRTLDVQVSHVQPSVFGRVIGVTNLTTGTSARAMPPGPSLINATYAVAAVSADAGINGGGAAVQVVGGPVYAYGSFGANNAPHATGTPAVQMNFDGTSCPGNPANHIDNGGAGNGLAFTWTGATGVQNSGVAPPVMFDSAAPTLAQPAPTYTTTAAAVDGLGNWKPGIYDSIFPSGGKMNPGVYKLINVARTIALGSITNTIYTPSGTEDADGAVAIALDNTDTGSLDISQAVLNGLDDLHPQGFLGPRDPQGTHNFVLWGGNRATGYKGSVSIGPGAGTDMSGIIYLPGSAYNSNGNSSPQFTGSLIVASMTVNGGGNGQQLFKWVCGLNSVTGTAFQGGLVR